MIPTPQQAASWAEVLPKIVPYTAFLFCLYLIAKDWKMSAKISDTLATMATALAVLNEKLEHLEDKSK